MPGEETMKVRTFQVVPSNAAIPLEHVLGQVHAMQLEDRLRTLVGGKSVRVETVLPPAARKPYWLLDFVWIRFKHGPGRAHARRPVVDFPMGQGDGFGEETAMLYDPQHARLFMQYNHQGIKEVAAASYLGMIPEGDVAGFDILPTLDPATEAKLAGATQFSRFTMKVAPGRINANLRRNNVALGRALDVADEFRAPAIEVSMSVGHARTSLAAEVVRHGIDFVRRAFNADNGAVLGAFVEGKQDPEAESEKLDLLFQKWVLEVDGLELGPGRRYTQASRFRALERARLEWLRQAA